MQSLAFFCLHGGCLICILAICPIYDLSKAKKMPHPLEREGVGVSRFVHKLLQWDQIALSAAILPMTVLSQ